MTETLRVLLIEDNPGDERLIREHIAEVGSIDAAVTSSATLDGGLAYLATAPFDVVLLDLTLPDSFGIDTVRAVVESNPDLPIVVLTGADDQRLAEHAIQLGAQDYLPKQDISAQLLARAIRHAIERQEALKAVRESEQKFRTLFQESPIPIVIARPGGQGLIAANAAYLKMMGFEESDVESLTLAQTTHPEDLEADLAGIEKTQTGESRTFHREKRLIRKNGEVVWARVVGTLFRDEHGEPEQVLVVQQDITAEREATEKLISERERLQSVMETMPAFLYLQAKDHTIRFANSLFLHYFGEPRGRKCHQIFRGSNEPCAPCSTLEVLDSGEELVREWTDAEGRTFEIRERLYAAQTGEDLVLVIGTEITELVAATEALRRSESKFRELAEMLPEVVFECDLEGNLTYANQVAGERFGHTDQDFDHGLNIFDMVISQDRESVRKSVALLGQQYATTSHRFTAMRKDGSHFPVIARASAILQDDIPVGLRGIIIDYSELAEAQQAVEESEARLRQLFEAAPIGIGYHALDGTTLAMNATAVSRLSGTREDYLGRRLSDYSRDSAQVKLRFERALASDAGNSYVDEVTRPNGTFWYQRTYTALHDASGEAVGVQVISSDITPMKQAQNALQMAEDIVRSSPVGMFIYKYEAEDRLILVDANPEAERLTGLNLADWQGKEFNEIWPQARAIGFTQSLLDAFEGNRLFSRDDLEYSDHRTAGLYRIRAFRIPEDRLVVSFEDVSELRRTERALRDSELKYRSLFENAALGIYQTTPDGRVLAANQALVEMLGCASFEELAARNLEEEGYESAAERSQFRQELEQAGAVVGREASWNRGDGSVVYIRENARVVRNSAGEVLYYEGTLEDITTQKKSLAALEESEAMQRGILEASPVGTGLIQGETLQWVSDRVCEMTGYTAEQLIGQTPQITAPDEAEYRRIQQAMEADLQCKGVAQIETQWVRKDGTRFDADLRFASLDPQDPSQGGIFTVLDITERKAMERSLMLTQHSMDSTDVIILWLNSEGRIVLANQAGANILGYAREELVGLYAWDLQHDYPREQRETLWEHLSTREPADETVFSRKDGSTFPVELSAQRIEFQGLEYEFVFATDISERKAAELALRESEESYRAIFESASDVILLHDAVTGRVLEGNPKVEDLFGYTVPEFLELHGVESFSSGLPPYTQDEALRRIHAAAEGTPQVFEWHCKHRNGRLFWVEVSLRQAHVRGEDVVLAVVRDIDERKRLEAQLRQGQKLESIGTLASGVAHEINNPLMGMINYAELISSRVDDDSLREFAEGIKTEGNRVARIVRNLLSFSRQDQEEHSRARFSDIVDASMSLIGSLVRKDFIELQVDVPEDLPELRCRSQQIQQVIINLVTNARDSLNEQYPMAHENKVVRIQAQSLIDSDGEWLRATIEDTGIGIAEDVLDRIFDPFFTTKSRDEGTGLGLSISYGIVKDHGGRLTVESKPGVRTRFFVDLPTIPSDE